NHGSSRKKLFLVEDRYFKLHRLSVTRSKEENKMSQNTATADKPKTSLKAKVQKFGTFLSGMIMPNIAAIIAWGLVTALFLNPGGWFPSPTFIKLSAPMLSYLLPLLIGYTGGKMVDDERGGIFGGIATI